MSIRILGESLNESLVYLTFHLTIGERLGIGGNVMSTFNTPKKYFLHHGYLTVESNRTEHRRHLNEAEFSGAQRDHCSRVHEGEPSYLNCIDKTVPDWMEEARLRNIDLDCLSVYSSIAKNDYSLIAVFSITILLLICLNSPHCKEKQIISLLPRQLADG